MRGAPYVSAAHVPSFPFIDAVMRQLRAEGWINNQARMRVCCFLTRGDLWQHWEAGAKVFELYLLDADWRVPPPGRHHSRQPGP